jgi:transcription elongation GreA/GreB family factor
MSTTKTRVVLTPGGRRRLDARLDEVRAEFGAVVDDMPAALESGDTSGWHDNFAFEDNQRRQQQLAHRLRDLERLRDSAETAPLWDEAPSRAYVGAAVRWCYADELEVEREVWLAGFGDGDPEQRRVSYDAPLGRALLGAEPGEERPFAHNGHQRKVLVIEVGPTPPGADEAPLRLPAPEAAHAR